MPTLLEAFTTLGLSPDTPEDEARAAYKRLALCHHPDRNHGDAGATERFQQIGAAWEVCLRHYEGGGSAGSFEGRHYAHDEDVPLDEEEAQYFFRFMFEEMLFNRFSYARARRYRDQRSGEAGGGMHAFSGGFAESQKRQDDNAARIRKENDAYHERVRELDREIAAEQAAEAQRAREAASAQDRLLSLQHRAFTLARAGDGAGLRATVTQSSLDVTGPERLARAKDDKPYETLLHVAAGKCDVPTVEFLLARGADPAAISPANLTPFHAAVLHGNAPVAAFLLARPRHAEEGAHPSKAAPDGRTPLQLALVQGNIEALRIVLRHATVHDVARAWAMDGLTAATREVLLTKKGFVPPAARGAPTSQQDHKAERKAEQARLAKEEKKNRVEEQERRAEENRKRREERAQRALEEAAVREKARLQEEARQKAQEEARRLEAEEAHRQGEARRQAREESRQRQAAQRQAAEETRRQDEARREAETRARNQAEQARRAAEERAAAEARRVAKLVQEEQQRLRDEEDARLRRVALERLERESQIRRETEEAEMRRRQEEQRAREAEQEAIRYAEDERQRQEEAKVRAREEEAHRIREADKMRRRAEQSARDKARNQRIRAERELERARQRQAPDARTDTHAQPTTHLQTPPSPPRPVAPPSPPMTPEDIQTRATEEGLFAYEPPARTARSGPHDSVYGMQNNGMVEEVPASQPQARQSRGGYQSGGERGRGGRGRGRGRGNVFRGRGRGRGGTRGSRLGLEEQLERKEMEIKQIRAQLAGGSAGVR